VRISVSCNSLRAKVAEDDVSPMREVLPENRAHDAAWLNLCGPVFRATLSMTRLEKKQGKRYHSFSKGGK